VSDHGSGECKEIFARLSEYLDAELDPGLCSKLEGHLDGCPPCRVFLESLRRTVRLVESVETPGLSEAERRTIREAYDRLRDST
jgi:anti-sigma factor RsiW